MSLKQRLTTAVIATATLTAQSTTIIGNVRDAETGEALIGVAIAVSNTTKGAASDLDGNYSLGNLGAGTYTLRASYLSYETQEQTITLGKEQTATLDWRMTPQSTRLNEVTIAAKKQLDNERSLMNERKNSTLAIENIGARELSAKGISNAEEGVKKITGVSIADAGQLIVRGLGDRYSTTTLNTLPIASPNPDKKLIPLNLFPSSTIQNITVSKVYDPEYYADYSGAHVDISTKENTGKDFLNIGLNIGGNSITTLRETLQMDRDGSQLKTPSLEDKIRDMKKSDFREYIKSKNIFSTDFSVRKKRALPNLGGSISGGKSFRFGRSSLDLMGAVNIENSNQTNNNGIVRILEATGNTLSEFEYDSYKEALKTTGLGNITYSFRGTDRIGYTILYSREREDTYMLREGYDEEGIELTGSNNVTHIYSLLNQQISGHNEIERWELDWGGSYVMTGSSEPDRRQVMYERGSDGSLSLFKLNQQETMRYFGKLDEDEAAASLKASWRWGKRGSKLMFGGEFKNKTRGYDATRFYYNVKGLNGTVENPLETNTFLNQANIENGTIIVDRNHQPKDQYDALSRVIGGYLKVDCLLDDKEEQAVCELSGSTNLFSYSVHNTDIYNYDGVKTKYISSISYSDEELLNMSDYELVSGSQTITAKLNSNKVKDIHHIEIVTDTGIAICKSFYYYRDYIEMNIDSSANTVADIIVFGKVIKESYDEKTVFKGSKQSTVLEIENYILRGASKISKYTNCFAELLQLKNAIIQVEGFINPQVKLDDMIKVIGKKLKISSNYKVIELDFTFGVNYDCKAKLIRTVNVSV